MVPTRNRVGTISYVYFSYSVLAKPVSSVDVDLRLVPLDVLVRFIKSPASGAKRLPSPSTNTGPISKATVSSAESGIAEPVLVTFKVIG